MAIVYRTTPDCPPGQSWDTIDNVCREEKKLIGPVSRVYSVQLRSPLMSGDGAPSLPPSPSPIPESDPERPPVMTAPIPPDLSLPPITGPSPAEAADAKKTNKLVLLGGAALLAYLVFKK